MELYLRFILDMARSHGFQVYGGDYRALNTRFRSASGTQYLKLPVTITRRTVLQKEATPPPFNGLYDCL